MINFMNNYRTDCRGFSVRGALAWLFLVAIVLLLCSGIHDAYDFFAPYSFPDDPAAFATLMVAKIAVAIWLLQGFVVLGEGVAKVVLRHGEYRGTLTGNGLQWCLPSHDKYLLTERDLSATNADDLWAHFSWTRFWYVDDEDAVRSTCVDIGEKTAVYTGSGVAVRITWHVTSAVYVLMEGGQELDLLCLLCHEMLAVPGFDRLTESDMRTQLNGQVWGSGITVDGVELVYTGAVSDAEPPRAADSSCVGTGSSCVETEPSRTGIGVDAHVEDAGMDVGADVDAGVEFDADADVNPGTEAPSSACATCGRTVEGINSKK